MNNEFEIVSVKGREILDSRGNPTIEAEVTLENGAVGRAAVPSGASTGKFEAVELRDRDTRYHGLGVSTAAGNIVNVIGETVLFENALEQRKIDRLMIDADGTENKEKLGANAILGVSMAVARAAAEGLHIPRRNRGIDAACSDDEYPERRPTCRQYGGFAGIHDYACRGIRLFRRFENVFGNLPHTEKGIK